MGRNSEKKNAIYVPVGGERGEGGVRLVYWFKPRSDRIGDSPLQRPCL
jgi:hypothetical protein